MSETFHIYYNDNGSISQVSPSPVNDAGPYITVSKTVGSKFCNGDEPMRNYKVDLTKTPPKLQSIIKKPKKQRSHFYLIPTVEYIEEDMLLTYNSKKNTLTIKCKEAVKSQKLFFITAVNNPIKLLQTLEINEGDTACVFDINDYPFSIFTWEEESSIGYMEE